MNFLNCALCAKCFKDSPGLDLHMKKVHGETLLQGMDRKQAIAKQEIQKKEELPTPTEDEKKEESPEDEQNWEDLEENEESEEEEEEVKLYKIKYYPNSDGNPMGLTLKGKAKDHVESHKKITEIMDRLPRAKESVIGGSKIKMIEKPHKTPSLLTRKLQITAPDKSEGTVELKMHKPALKKGSTLEIRKTNDGDFETVDKLKDVIVKLFDLIATGETVSRILLSAKGKQSNQPLPVITLLSCNQCDWKTKTKTALKAHITRLHGRVSKTKNNCDICGFVSSSTDIENHKKEFHLVHNNIRLQAKVSSNLKRNRSIKSTES